MLALFPARRPGDDSERLFVASSADDGPATKEDNSTDEERHAAHTRRSGA